MSEPSPYSVAVRALRVIDRESLQRANEGKQPYTKAMAAKRAELLETIHTGTGDHAPCAICESGNFDQTGVL